MDPHDLHAELVEFEVFQALCLGRCKDETEALQAQKHQQLEEQTSEDDYASADDSDRDLHAHMTKNRKSQAKQVSSETKAVPSDMGCLLSKNNSKGSKE